LIAAAGHCRADVGKGANMGGINPRETKFAILEFLSKNGKAHRFNMLGRPYQTGSLEHVLGAKFDQSDRALADRAFEALKHDGLIEPTYTDIADPENWVQITEAGKEALSRRTLDDLDGALYEIDPHLVDIRDGAWASAWSAQPDALRQAAHSGRGLIDQTLKAIAPDDEVRGQPNFKPDQTSKTGITRRHRIRLGMKKRKGVVSNSDAKITDKACELVICINDKLLAQAHARSKPVTQDVIDALQVAEIALRKVIV
jgi:Predicted pPIWI-associating nuclease